jgi:transposase
MSAIIEPREQVRVVRRPRVLAEIGDDRTRLADARALKAYAGSAPVTRASGKSSRTLRGMRVRRRESREDPSRSCSVVV